MHQLLFIHKIIFSSTCFEPSAHLQEDTVVQVQHMVLSLSMRVLGGLSVLSISESSHLRVKVPYAARVQLYPPEDGHLRLETCRGE